MRALAILAVVLYHAHLGVVRGGYVGVDVFFVISGFLITGLLVREAQDTGRVSFSAFYARRVRRLLPASLVVLVVSAVASAAWLPPLQARGVLKDGLASALYVGNYRFALAQTNYLTAAAAPSPFQHYWSLGVEEQFYLVWPLLLVGVSFVWWRGRPSRAAAAAALAALGGGSFALSLWLTQREQPWAFFSLPTRAWELAAGGLVALAAPALARRRPPPDVGWLGLGLVLWSVFFLSPSTPYPGVAALAPVLGTAAVLACGCGSTGRGPVLALRATGLQVIGRVSYSWYLWHWPVLVLAPYALGRAVGLGENLLLAAGSFVLAVVTFVLVEQPVRSSTRLQRLSGRRVLQVGGVLSAAAACTCLVVVATLPSVTGHGTAPVAALPHVALSRAETRARAAGARPATAPAGWLDAQELAATDAVQKDIRRSLRVRDVPANLQPSLAGADADEPAPFVDGCLDSYLSSAVAPCTFGDTTSSTSVVLFGDSHAAMWFPAVDAAADALGWKLLTLTKATCPPLDLPVFSPVLGRAFTECTQWRENVLARIAAVKPALVVLGVARHYSDVYHFTVYGPQWTAGLSAMVRAVRALGPQVLVLGPVPKPPFDVPGCLSVHLSDAPACTESRSQGINGAGMAAERAAVQGAGGTYLDVAPWFCTRRTCAVVVDDLDVYRDDNHITRTYAAFLTPALQPELERARGSA